MPSKFEDYEVLERIGSGSFGICRKIRRKSDGKTFVWKELNYGNMSDSEKKMLVSEVNVLRELKHPNIVRYVDRIIDRNSATIFIVMEYCGGGDLGTLISKHRREKKFMDEGFVWKLLFQLVLALRECHRRKEGGHVLHRDLKPANVFLDSRNNVKLGDFGLARVLVHDTSFAKTFVGTPYYMSPEQVDKMSYNEKSDIWSLGCLMYELCDLLPPFTAPNKKSLEEKIRLGRFLPLPTRYSSELSSIISSMLRVDVHRRPCIEDLLGNPVLSKFLRESSTEEDDIQTRENNLRRRELRLEEKEMELERREKSLETRERLLSAREDKVSGLEKKMSQASRYHNFRDAAPLLERKFNKYDRNLGMGKENDDYWNIKPFYHNDLGTAQEVKLTRDMFIPYRGHRHARIGPNPVSNRIPGFQLNVL